MLRNSDYIYNNVLIADEKVSTKQYCKKTTGVDLSVKNFYNLTSPGTILKHKTIVGNYSLIKKQPFLVGGQAFTGWFLPKGSYLCELNEGCKFGPNDVGYIIQRSSLNRNCVELISSVWDPSFTTQNENSIDNMSVRINVHSETGIYIEENARVGQLLVFVIEDGEQYNAQEHQFQGRGLK